MNAESVPPRRTRVVGLVLLAATFLTGTLAGIAADRVLLQDGRGPVRIVRAVPPPRDGHRGLVFDALDLTPDQRERIRGILERRRAQMAAHWEEAAPGMRALVDSTDLEIRAALTPEQRERFDRLRAERRSRHGKPRGRGWRSPGAELDRGPDAKPRPAPRAGGTAAEERR